MKLLKSLIILISIAAFSFAISSCGNKAKAKTETTEKQGKEYTSAYICPMHCDGSGSAEEGKCPVCGMDYVKNEDYKAEENHEGHNH